jgi:hypothetical protein
MNAALTEFLLVGHKALQVKILLHFHSNSFFPTGNGPTSPLHCRLGTSTEFGTGCQHSTCTPRRTGEHRLCLELFAWDLLHVNRLAWTTLRSRRIDQTRTEQLEDINVSSFNTIIVQKKFIFHFSETTVSRCNISSFHHKKAQAMRRQNSNWIKRRPPTLHKSPKN